MNRPMMRSCSWVDFEKQMGLRTKRLSRVRSVTVYFTQLGQSLSDLRSEVDR